MYSRGRVLRFTAVMATVVLALTGFSSGHKSSGRHKSSHSHRDSDGGGGCSTSRQDHDSYTPSRSTSTRRASVLQDGTAVLVSCATKATPYATVEVSNPNSRRATFEVEFAFQDATGRALNSVVKQISVPARGTSNVQVKASGSLLAKLDHCRVEPEADRVG
ncbi:hypothetical protein [Streptomyces pseudovenezuelae]|uniref:Uncharacterized protein n=1 Tax=Streptomyces pseudovenezuelae TaxID=67350 RepID=A0A101MYP3_9ACTN|nr:hypothetical protein [Streptomyces pseudovenezuelae]KUM83278.1 hypothetical protein AQI94_37075 [Streptomyces pseudovenezuelae]